VCNNPAIKPPATGPTIEIKDTPITVEYHSADKEQSDVNREGHPSLDQTDLSTPVKASKPKDQVPESPSCGFKTSKNANP
jgi:hypothetical protein